MYKNPALFVGAVVAGLQNTALRITTTSKVENTVPRNLSPLTLAAKIPALLACAVSISAMALLSACSGGGGSSSASVQPTVQTGSFVDSAVNGLQFETNSQAGITNAAGEFEYLPGETVSFSIGGIQLGSAVGAATLSPLALLGVDNVAAAEAAGVEAALINRLVFLQSLDQDNNPENGIDLVGLGETLVEETLDFDVSTATFAQGDYRRLVNENGGVYRSPTAAINHLLVTLVQDVDVILPVRDLIDNDGDGQDDQIIEYVYDDAGNLIMISDVNPQDDAVQRTVAITYNDQGKVSSVIEQFPAVDNASATVQSFEYDPQFGISRYLVTQDDTALVDISYAYDAVGNVINSTSESTISFSGSGPQGEFFHPLPNLTRFNSFDAGTVIEARIDDALASPVTTSASATSALATSASVASALVNSAVSGNAPVQTGNDLTGQRALTITNDSDEVCVSIDDESHSALIAQGCSILIDENACNIDINCQADIFIKEIVANDVTLRSEGSITLEGLIEVRGVIDVSAAEVFINEVIMANLVKVDVDSGILELDSANNLPAQIINDGSANLTINVGGGGLDLGPITPILVGPAVSIDLSGISGPLLTIRPNGVLRAEANSYEYDTEGNLLANTKVIRSSDIYIGRDPFLRSIVTETIDYSYNQGQLETMFVDYDYEVGFPVPDLGSLILLSPGILIMQEERRFHFNTEGQLVLCERRETDVLEVVDSGISPAGSALVIGSAFSTNSRDNQPLIPPQSCADSNNIVYDEAGRIVRVQNEPVIGTFFMAPERLATREFEYENDQVSFIKLDRDGDGVFEDNYSYNYSAEGKISGETRLRDGELIFERSREYETRTLSALPQ
ncbi:MAG: hypothetical protein KUG79_05910 [Pseudomonadales bacterium]|nr:hypothetical protein [Pseudomonadales bacterium]